MDIAGPVIDLVIAGGGYIALGTLLGIVAGVLPGFGGANTLIVLLPLTLAMPVNAALLFIVGLFSGVRLGGAIPAILINVPGTGSSAVTAFDGYPLCKQGRANEALGVSLMASAVGGFLSGLLALAATPLLAKIALAFSSVEIFALTMFAVAMVGQIAGQSLLKGWLAGFFGLLIGSVGVDSMWGIERATFGMVELLDGMPVIPALVGLFAITEILFMVEREWITATDDAGARRKSGRERVAEIWGGAVYAIRKPVDLIRASFIGSFVGALPGAGANIASFLSYQQAIAFSKTKADRELFGQGNPRGIVAAEAADNACSSGALIPVLTLGIPGSSSTAVMLVLMSIHGLTVGPRLFIDHPVTAYAVLLALPISAVWVFLFGALAVYFAARIVVIPTKVLAPVIGVLALTGAYAARYLYFDVFLALGFGVLGYAMRQGGYPPQAMLIGIILAPIVETNFFIGLREGFGSPAIFFTRPIALGIWLTLVASTAYTIWHQRKAAHG